jgi:putative membrane protein
MRLVGRILIIWVIDAVALWLLAHVLPGLELSNWQWAIWAVAVIGLLNALVRPLLLLLTMPFTVMTLGLLSVGLNAAMVLIADLVLPGFSVADLLAALWVVLGVTLINTVVTGLLSINDDESFYRNVVLRIARRTTPVPETATPGIVFLEVDGLSASMLERALNEGYMPNLKRLTDRGEYRLARWDCGLPSQTSSSQAGILYGRNDDIPAFRWYEKDIQRLMVSNRPFDAAEIHRRLSDGTGLLAPHGSSLTNLVSGDAEHAALTMSAIWDSARGVRRRSANYFLYFLNPYSFTRTLVLMIWEILRELGQRMRARFRQPRAPSTRGGSFPLLRAATNVFLRDLNLYLLIEHMFTGTPVIYSTFLGFDVVAHHAGPGSRDALLTLRQFDDELASLRRAARPAPRPYFLVLLSDHGQSPGATFRQRYGLTLEDLVREVLEADVRVSRPGRVEQESWGHLNALVSQAIQADTVAGRTARRVLRRRIHDGYVEIQARPRERQEGEPEVVVCTSGNLGLIYFTAHPERLTLEDLSAEFPGVVERLASHEGIGFLLVHSEQHGPIAIGRRGLHYLETGRVEGSDPLEPFGARATRYLRRIAGFSNIGDIVVNSMYDPDTGEVAAFEDLVGSHGGLGGDQSEAFVLYPRDWSGEIREDSDPCEIHGVFRAWIRDHVDLPQSVALPDRSPAPAGTP